MKTTPTEPIRILQLEDNADDAELIAIELRRAWGGCKIVAVQSLELFESNLRHERFDAILSDFALRGCNAFDALQVARTVAPDVPFIAISGTIGEEKAVELLKAGAIDYVLKDRPARLAQSIERAMRDVALRRRNAAAEQKVRETEERFRQLAESSGDVFWFADLDPEFRIRFISAAVESVWGRPPADFYADSSLWLQAIHPEDRGRVEAQFRAWISGDVPRIVDEFRVVRADGVVRWVHNTGTAATDEGGRNRRLSGIARDITQTKEAIEQTLRAQRLESIGLLAGGVAHDLNNALAPILMGLDLMRPQLPAALLPMYENMQISANRGAAMVRQLLSFARGAGGQKMLVDVRRAVRELEQLTHSTFPKGVTTIVRVSGNTLSVEMDPTLLHQVLLNLCVNARDAMPSGGTLSIEAQRTEVDESYAGFIREARPGAYVLISVTDTGTGINPEMLPKIFDPFFTTKPMGVGTGLGLTTVAGIVHNHRGFLQVESQLGRGTTFKIFLPAAEAAGAATLHDVALPEYNGNGKGVMIVDDEEPVRTLLKQLLERFRFRVFVAGDGAEGLAIYAANQAGIDLVIADERMPHLDGISFVRALRHLAPTLPVIAMSGLLNESHVKEFATLGVTHFLHKPFALTELIDAVAASLGDGSSQQELALQGPTDG